MTTRVSVALEAILLFGRRRQPRRFGQRTGQVSVALEAILLFGPGWPSNWPMPSSSRVSVALEAILLFGPASVARFSFHGRDCFSRP